MQSDEPSTELVGRLVADQCPTLRGLPVEPVEGAGFDNATFRLGDDLVVRLPRHPDAVGQVAKEQRWLPILAPVLPVTVPTPVHHGAPSPEFDRPWSILRWVDGTPLGPATVDLPSEIGADLADVLAALHRVPTDGAPRPGASNHHRGGPLDRFDEDVRSTIERLDGLADGRALTAVWDAGLASRHTGEDVWIHGDMTGSNLLVDRRGRLCGVIDFGCCAVGDPACDLAPAWTNLDGPSRDRFVEMTDVDEATWARARAWTLWKAIKHLADLPDDHPRNDGHRLGWRATSLDVVEILCADAMAP